MNKIGLPIVMTSILQNRCFFYKNYNIIILVVLLIFSVNNIFSQAITENSELKKEVSQIKYYTNNPCENPNGISIRIKNNVAHFIRFESCHEDKTKLKGIVYGVLIIDDTLYKVSLETAEQFLFNNGTFLDYYKKLDKTQRLFLEKHNLKLNSDYYNELREAKRKAEEKRRLEEEEKRRIEIEKKRLEEEQIAKIKAQELSIAIQKATTDSLTNENLKPKIVEFAELIKKQDAEIEAKIKKGVDNGGVLVTQFSFSVSDYGVVDLTLGIKNVGKKRIKYATFNLQPSNSVDDPVEYDKSFKGIGFIEPNEEGVWEFESAWFSDVIYSLELKNITLLYEDGGTKFISKIGEIRVDDYEFLESIKDRQKKIMHQFGSVALIELKDALSKMVGLCIYSVSNEEVRTEVFPEEESLTIISDLGQIISNRKSGIISKVGSFEVLSHSTMIYFYLKDGYCLLSLNDAENLLKKLEELF